MELRSWFTFLKVFSWWLSHNNGVWGSSKREISLKNLRRSTTIPDSFSSAQCD